MKLKFSFKSYINSVGGREFLIKGPANLAFAVLQSYICIIKSNLCIYKFRSQKVAGTMQTLLGGHEIYHYHSKLMMKDAKTGGAHVWHQDYGSISD